MTSKFGFGMGRRLIPAALLLLYAHIQNAAFLVDIISPVSTDTQYGASMMLTGPAMDMGVEYLRRHYSEVFQVRHTYIYL